MCAKCTQQTEISNLRDSFFPSRFEENFNNFYIRISFLRFQSYSNFEKRMILMVEFAIIHKTKILKPL